MSRPPKKAIEQIKNYCEKTQCRRCVFGITDDYPDYVGCSLQEVNSCDWDLLKEEVSDGH